ncbi:M15 family metallopeptidase [Flavobacteriaceae bacterium F89]|uniref:M15 family metallopeptidase n=1 Tax=Cerina litoralis TaxID=2874477 RepID=A0AAE3ESX6_9FLAO|nr:M15 family metallopeptidase [Cerina litoralis]MCG2460505.1 M15 family metallopeptidase [Cerina litoralis]
MQRRSFLQKCSVSGLAFTILPNLAFPTTTEYTIEELMGKANIELFGKDVQLRKEAYEAFTNMKKAAYSDGIDLKVVSSYRSFEHQARIWDRKYINYVDDEGLEPLDAIDKIIEYSTIPGTSRHHWGTDIDLVDGYQKVDGDVLDPEKFEVGKPYASFKKWMDGNSKKYDFYLVYTDNPKRRGFKYEPWHYSYAPLSIPMLTQFRKKNILKLLSKEEIMGSDHFTTGLLRSYIQDNILDINRELL